MPQTLVKLVAVFLLCVQVVVASVPGRMLCIPVADCGGGEQSVSACDHRHHEGPAEGHKHSHGDSRGGTHGLLDLALHPDDACACHVHLPVPGETPVPSKPTPRGDHSDLRELAVPLAVVAIIVLDGMPQRGLEVYWHEPDFNRTGQVLSLRSTRMLI